MWEAYPSVNGLSTVHVEEDIVPDSLNLDQDLFDKMWKSSIAIRFVGEKAQIPLHGFPRRPSLKRQKRKNWRDREI